MFRLYQWLKNSLSFLKPNTQSEPAYSAPQTEVIIELDEISEIPARTPITETVALENDISAWEITSQFTSIIFAKDNLPRIAGATVLTGLHTGLNFLAPYLFGETISLLSNDDNTTTVAGIELTREALISLLIASYALTQIVPNLRDQLMVPVTTRNTKEIITKSTEHLLQKPLSYQVNTPFSDQIYFMQKSFAVSSIGTPLLTQIAPIIVEICIACAVLSTRYGPMMGSGLLGLLASYTAYGSLTTRPIINAREASLKAGNEAFENFAGAIKRYKTMHDFGHFDYVMKGVNEAISKMCETDRVALLRPLQISIGHYSLSNIAVLIAALYVGIGVKSNQFSVQEFVVIVGYLNQLSSLLPSFGAAMNQLFASYPDLRFVFRELAKSDKITDAYPDASLAIIENSPPIIEFDNVCFSYPANTNTEQKPPLFQNLSFTITSGQTVALVSESGAGKTTIFNLLYRYYAPTSGTIRINGQDIAKVGLNSLQKHISLLGQNPNLFKGSMRDNIRFGAANPDEVTDEIIFQLARSANLEEFIRSFHSQLDTDVGEDGKALSGGQQQKVAILRGLLKQGAIRLLDEITAPFDSNSASSILHSIKQSSQSVTTLMITHKLTEAQCADLILVIDQGQVIAQGTHDELLTSCSLYQRLWQAYISEENPANTRLASSTASILTALGGAAVHSSKEEHKSEDDILPVISRHSSEERLWVQEETQADEESAFKLK
jgi:ABC-type multidrug transport system fused ATPase/permease subunit